MLQQTFTLVLNPLAEMSFMISDFSSIANLNKPLTELLILSVEFELQVFLQIYLKPHLNFKMVRLQYHYSPDTLFEGWTLGLEGWTLGLDGWTPYLMDEYFIFMNCLYV